MLSIFNCSKELDEHTPTLEVRGSNPLSRTKKLSISYDFENFLNYFGILNSIQMRSKFFF